MTLPATYVGAGHLTHGWAITVHKAQGLTVDTAFVLGSERLYREAGYVALSRARHDTYWYQVAPPGTQLPPLSADQEAARLLGRSNAQHLATPLPEPHHPEAEHPGTHPSPSGPGRTTRPHRRVERDLGIDL